MKWYNGNRLLNLLDANKRKPEILISTGNRSIGKSYFFNSFLTKNYLKNKRRFCLVYRNKYELVNIADKFFTDISQDFPNITMTEKTRGKGAYVDLFFNDEVCGHAVALAGFEQVKKYAHVFKYVDFMLFDEFQSEADDYLKNEVGKLISIHTSIARGGGQAVRFVPVIMISNTVSLLNPYYTALNIAEKIQEKTKILRGNGVVFEKTLNYEVSNMQKRSAFNMALSGESEVAYLSDNVYLNDNYCLVGKMQGKKDYIFTLKCDNIYYGVYESYGLVYISKNYDLNFPVKYACHITDIDYEFTYANELIKGIYRNMFKQGLARFENLACKKVFIDYLHY